MKLRHLLFAAGLAPAVLNAATEFDNGLVPVELVRQFTSGTIYRSLPDGFPVVSLPAGTDVRLLGSMQRGATRDALLTTQKVGALYTALMTAYAAAGWTTLTENTTAGVTQLCHNRLGTLTITRPAPGYNGLRLTHTQSYLPPGQSCTTIAVSNATPWVTYFFGLMPTLTPPPQAVPAGQFVPYLVAMRSTRYNSGGGGSVTLDYDKDISVPNINIAGLYAHFAARLAEQGWQIDSEDTGVRSALAVLYKTVAPPAGVVAGDTRLTGTLRIFSTAGTEYRVTFALEAATDAAFNVGGSFAVPYDILGNGFPLNDPQLGIRGIPAGFTVR